MPDSMGQYHPQDLIDAFNRVYKRSGGDADIYAFDGCQAAVEKAIKALDALNRIIAHEEIKTRLRRTADLMKRLEAELQLFEEN